MNKKGITLIEMVTVIVVLAVAIPPLLTMLGDVVWRSARSETIADGTFYAQELIEEVQSKKFDENDALPWTSTSAFGTDAGENRNNKDTFDDLDDFVGCTDSRVIVPAAGFTRSVAVEYVTLNGSTWQTCGTVNCANSTDCANCTSCCYKRVTVSVSGSNKLGSDINLTTLISAP